MFFFDLLIIKHFDPFYLIPIDTCYYISYETIDFFLSLSKTNSLNNIRFIIEIFSELISIICCCIYLEIIELHFCNLDENIKRKIIFRGKLDKTSTELVIKDEINMDESFEEK